VTSWKSPTSGYFDIASNWSGGVVPSSDDFAEITNIGTFTVTSDQDQTVTGLLLGSHVTLAVTGGIFSVTDYIENGNPNISIAQFGLLTIGDGAEFLAAGENRSIQGYFSIAPGGTLAGASGLAAGEIAMGGSGAELTGLGNFGTITGGGEISGSVVNYEKSSLIDADIPASPLTLPPSNNFGTLEATNGAGLILSGSGVSSKPVLGQAGLVQAVGTGSYVELENLRLLGGAGTLSTSGGGVIRIASDASFYGYTVDAADVLVGAGDKLMLFETLINSGVITLESTSGDVASLAITSLDDYRAGQKESTVTRTVVLRAAGSIVLSDTSANLIFATGSADTLDNESNTISGAGRIGGGSAMRVVNRGVIDASGTNPLVIDIATGTLTNGAAGVLEATGPGGLSIAGGTVKNTGTVQARDGSSVTFGSGATITNDVAGKLAGGHWFVTDGGHGASLTLSGAAVTTLAGKVELSGAGSMMETGGSTLLEASLTTIAAGGDLELLNGRGWTSALSLTDNAQLKLIGGTFAAAGLRVGAAGTVSAVGTLAAPTRDNGLVRAYRGVLDITGDVTGTGTLKIYGSSTLEIGGGLASTVDVLFGTGTHESLKIGEPDAFASTLTNWFYGDTIDLLATDATSAQIVGNTLQISLFGGGTLDYTLANPSAGRLVLAGDGAGGVNITLFKAAPAAMLGQAMATMAGGGAPAIGSPAPSAAASRLATMAAPR
jgi:hypothetical protein